MDNTILKLFKKIIDNTFLFAIIIFLISIPIYNGSVKLYFFIIVAAAYFLINKKIIAFKNLVLFSLIFSLLRPIYYLIKIGILSFLFSSNKIVNFCILDFLNAFFVFYLSNIILYCGYKIIRKEKFDFSLMKENFKKFFNSKKTKIALALILIIIGFFFVKELPKYRYGYFVDGPEMKYQHFKNSFIKLENGNILAVGENFIDADDKINYTPAEI